MNLMKAAQHRGWRRRTLANGFVQYHGCSALQSIDAKLICDRKDNRALKLSGEHNSSQRDNAECTCEFKIPANAAAP